MNDAIERLNAALEGRYHIERQLGEGGMATVYLAKDLKHNRNVALKVLKPELAAVVGAERFLAEIETTANLQHPHILPLFDSGEADGFLFYVMPFVEGESLREKLGREKQLSVDEAVRISSRTAEALDYAHRHGVIHRDVKPGNILIHDGQPVVSDFGIALAVGEAGAQRLTETGLSMGTPHYMSPERATGDGVVGPATDTYALGCVLYEMLVGEPPYTGSTTQAVLGKIITAEPDSVTRQRRAVPEHVDSAVRKALEKLPADRFATTRGLSDALADPSFRYGDAAASAAGGAPRVQRQPWAAWAVAGLLVVGLVWSLGRGGGSEDTASTPVSIDRSVAVIPFVNTSGDPDNEYFSDGITDELLNALAQLPDLRVPARTSSFAFKGQNVPIQEIADALGVAYVLTGSVGRDGQRVAIYPQLVKAEIDSVAWSQRYERELTDILSIQREIATAIADQLQITLSGDQEARLARRDTVDLEAHDYYLRGRQLLYQRGASMLEAIGAFRAAVQADPLYAPAHVGLASAYSLAVDYYFAPPDSSYAWVGRALAHADRAIALDSTDAEAYAVRGFAVTLGPGEPAETTERDFDSALALQPSSADAWGWYGQLLARRGRIAEAREAEERSLPLDRVAPGRRIGYAAAALSIRDHQLALDQIRRAREIQPDLGALAQMMEGYALLLLGRSDECLRLNFPVLAVEAACLHESGEVQAAAAIADSIARDWDRTDWLTANTLAGYFAWTGQLDEALQWMERGLDESPYSTSAWPWPPGLWDRVDAARVRSTIDRLAADAWRRVDTERQRSEVP